MDSNKFKETTIPNFFLGSQGKKITLAYVEPDDFYILEPDYNTKFQKYCPTWENITGNFHEVMFYKKAIEETDLYKAWKYGYYLRGNQPYLRLVNKCENTYNKKVLLIRDSFNEVVSPYLALVIKDLTMLDTRYFTGSVRTFLEKEKFDLIIIAYNASFVSGNSKLLDFD